MASSQNWLRLLAALKACHDLALSGVGFEKALLQHLNEADTQAEARRVSKLFTSYSDAEIEAILARINACKERFIREGFGMNRKSCLCSIFEDVKDGDGGKMP